MPYDKKYMQLRVSAVILAGLGATLIFLVLEAWPDMRMAIPDVELKLPAAEAGDVPVQFPSGFLLVKIPMRPPRYPRCKE